MTAGNSPAETSGSDFAYFHWHRATYGRTPPGKRRPWRFGEWLSLQAKRIEDANLAAYHGDIDGDFNY